MRLDANTIIRVLTTLSLGGLLFAVGLRLTWMQVRDALARSHLGWLLPVNFVLVPLIALGLIRVLRLDRDVAVGMLLLAASPFAPVVPVFARMSRGDLPLAAGLTALFPFVSAFLTPLICILCLRAIPGAETMHFSFLLILAILVATITLPLALGVVVGHATPALARAALRPLEAISEAAGAAS